MLMLRMIHAFTCRDSRLVHEDDICCYINVEIPGCFMRMIHAVTSMWRFHAPSCSWSMLLHLEISMLLHENDTWYYM